MKKIIALLSISLTLLTASKLDAVFAVAIASEANGFPHQVSYSIAYGPASGLVALNKAYAHVQGQMITNSLREGHLWTIMVRSPSIHTGDFSMAHGVYAIAQGILINPKNMCPTLCIGVGVDAKDRGQAARNAINDLQFSNLAAFGPLQNETIKILDQGGF